MVALRGVAEVCVSDASPPVFASFYPDPPPPPEEDVENIQICRVY